MAFKSLRHQVLKRLMQIDSNIIVKLGDGELEFEAPPLNAFAQIIGLEEKPLEEQADYLFSMLLGVRGNLQYRDGSQVTVESLKAHKITIPFFARLKTAYFTALRDAKSDEAAGKNDGTPAS